MHNQSSTNDRHRLRLQASLNHQESDRIPLTLGSPSCSLHINAQASLMNHLGFSQNNPVRITDNILQIVETDRRLLDYFDIDLKWLLPREAPVTWDADNSGYVDEFGRRFIAGGGFFNQIDHPLIKYTQEELESFIFPDLQQHKRFDHLSLQAKQIFDEAFGLGIDGPWGIYEISSSLVGTEQYLMDLVLNPRYARQVAEKVFEKYHIPFYDRLLAETAPYAQIVGISDDLGAQNGLLFSPNTFREIFKPLLRELVGHIQKLTRAKVYMHSDGSIYPIIPDLIEIGVEGLNPVQYTAKGMELSRLKNEFGKDLGFFGGVVENAALSFNSPAEIRKIVIDNVQLLKKDGGFIFAPIHNISQEVPPENIIAMYQAGLESGIY